MCIFLKGVTTISTQRKWTNSTSDGNTISTKVQFDPISIDQADWFIKRSLIMAGICFKITSGI